LAAIHCQRIPHPLVACLTGLVLGCGTATIGPSDSGPSNPDAGGTTDAGTPSDAGTDAGLHRDVCGVAPGTVAWTASIPTASTSQVPTDVVASSTNDDVVVGAIANGSTFEQYRWSSSGAVVSSHQDGAGAYTGPMFPSNLVLDSQNDVFYGLVRTGQPQGSNSGVSLTFARLAPDGTTLFSNTQVSALPASSGQPSVAVFQAGHDTGGGLHGTLAMVGTSPPAFPAAVYCWGPTGTDVGPSAQSVATTLKASDFLWPSLDGSLYLAQSVVASADLSYLGCGSLTASAAGATVVGKFGGGGNCLWLNVLALPSGVVRQRAFRQGADGLLSLAVVYSGTISLGGQQLVSSGTNSLALARFDSTGTLLWAKSFGGAGSSFTLGSLDTNAAGVSILSAGYSGSVDLGGGVLPTGGDTFLSVFDSAGTLRWSKVVTVGSSGQLLAAAGSCGLVLATNSLAVDVGTGPLSTASPPSSATIGVAALGL
jgi:hypothetical protein